MTRAMQIRTLLYALLIAGTSSAYWLLLEHADRLSWAKPTLIGLSLAFVAAGIFSSIKGEMPVRRGVINRSRPIMMFAIVLTLSSLASIYFSGTILLLIPTPRINTWINLIGGLFTFTYGLVQLIQIWQKRGKT